jgi:hypothetical protein
VTTPPQQDPDQQIADLPGKLPFVIAQLLGGAGGAGIAGAPAAASPAMDRYFREVLGFMVRDPSAPGALDVDAFVSALDRHYKEVTVEGTTEYQFTPYGGALPTERATLMITGAQASLYSRAAQAETAIQSMLDALFPLSEIADKEQAAASNAILASLVHQLVQELGAEGGPSALLIDAYFADLLDASVGDAPPDDPDTVTGAIGDLRDRYYLTRDRINVPAEEENYTKYLSVFDYLVSLYASWRVQRPFFTGETGQPYFGTLLVYLRRGLEVVVENGAELILRLDMADIGSAERKNLRVKKGPPANTWLYLQATLDSIREYASETAPNLIETAGRDGAISTYSTLWNMADDVEAFVGQPAGFPALYSDPLIQAAAASLATSLDEVVELVAELGPRQSLLEIMPRRQPSPAETRPPEQPRTPTPPSATRPIDVNVNVVPARSERLIMLLDRGQRGDQLILVRSGEDPADPATERVVGKPGLRRGTQTQFDFDLSPLTIEGESQDFDVHLERGDVTQQIDQIEIQS